MKKIKWIFAFIAITMLLSFAPTMSVSAAAHSHAICGGINCTSATHSTNHKAKTWQAWTSSNSLPSSAGNYYLTGNVNLQNEWHPTDGTNLCLNGKVIKMRDRTWADYDDTGAVLLSPVVVDDGCTVTLTDCKQTVHKFSEGEPYGYQSNKCYVLNESSGTITLKGGVITNGSRCGVKVDANGSCAIYNVNIVGNRIEDDTVFEGGAGVYNAGFFQMHSGRIEGNAASYPPIGDAISNAGTFYVYGGTISACSDSSDYPYPEHSIVYNAGGGKTNFLMKGGKITGGVDKRSALYNDGGDVTLDGGEISGCAGTGIYNDYGNVYLLNASKIADNAGDGIFSEGGSITLNTAGVGGVAGTGIRNNGGAGLRSPAVLEIERGDIVNNNGGGIICDNSSNITLLTNPVGSSKITIKDNTKDGAPCNLCAVKPITITHLNSGSYIGYTRSFAAGENPPVTIAENAPNCAQYFVSDDSTYSIIDGADNTLQLVGGSTSSTSSTNVAGHAEHDATWTSWTSATSLPTTAGNYMLANDVTLSSQWTAPDGTNICLNGHVIRSACTSGYAIKVEDHQTLTLSECTSVTHKYIVDSTCSTGYRLDDVNGTVSMQGGAVVGQNPIDVVRVGNRRHGGAKLNLLNVDITGSI